MPALNSFAQQLRTDYLEVLLNAYYPYFYFALFRAHELYNVEPYIELLDEPILDLGCGDGLIASLLFRKQLAWGVDISSNAVIQARRSKQYAQVILADGHNISLPDNSVGGIYSNCVLEHVNDMPGLLQEMARILKPGGCFIATCLTPDYYQLNPVFRALQRRPLQPLRARMIEAENALHNHVSVYTQAQYSDMLSRVGLKLQKHQYFAPSTLASAYSGWDTLSKYWLPFPVRLTHSGLISRFFQVRGKLINREKWLYSTHQRLAELCYQRPPQVTFHTGSAQIIVAHKPA